VIVLTPSQVFSFRTIDLLATWEIAQPQSPSSLAYVVIQSANLLIAQFQLFYLVDPVFYLTPGLQPYGVSADVGGFQYGLQLGFTKPRVHGLEVLEERLDQARYPVPGRCGPGIMVDRGIYSGDR